MRKKYKNRWIAKIVNPGFTMEQYEQSKRDEKNAVKSLNGTAKTFFF